VQARMKELDKLNQLAESHSQHDVAIDKNYAAHFANGFFKPLAFPFRWKA
jgi:hypothetical protein